MAKLPMFTFVAAMALKEVGLTLVYLVPFVLRRSYGKVDCLDNRSRLRATVFGKNAFRFSLAHSCVLPPVAREAVVQSH
jgi:hypothetical protein